MVFAFICDGNDNAVPPSPISPAAPENKPWFSCPHPIATLGTVPERPNVTVSVAKLPTVVEPSP